MEIKVTVLEMNHRSYNSKGGGEVKLLSLTCLDSDSRCRMLNTFDFETKVADLPGGEAAVGNLAPNLQLTLGVNEVEAAMRPGGRFKFKGRVLAGIPAAPPMPQPPAK